MRNKKLRNTLITCFCIFWILLFHYESTRAFWLEPFLKKYVSEDIELPKTKFLFPPAGWIMFYHVGPAQDVTEVYGLKDETPLLIDPHDIFETRTFGFDNIHRGILLNVSYMSQKRAFCGFLKRKFPQFDRFMVTLARYPDVIEDRYYRQQAVLYICE